MSAGKTSNRSAAHHVLFVLLGLMLVALSVRLFLFQKNCQAAMLKEAEIQQRITEPISARRGSIFANSYSQPVLLAASRQVPSCAVDVGFIADDELDNVARKLAEALGKSSDEVLKLFHDRRNDHFVWVQRDISEGAAEKVRNLKISAIELKSEWRREYPNGKMAAHVIGFSNVDGGVEGMESFAEKDLKATDGVRIVLGDVRKRPIWNAPGEYTAPADGHHVQLTLDVVIQKALEDALEKAVADFQAESAVGVVMDPRTGDVLAMANVPTYDLNEFGKATPDQLRNRAITDPYEPGSAFKPYVASVALEERKVHLGERIFCHNGAYHCLSGRNLHDAHALGDLSFEEILIHSSNIGMAILGERMGNDALYGAVRSFGFGQKTGIELKGEDAGLVNPLSKWGSYTTTSVPMGQEVGVTAIQLATAFSSLANNGKLLQPRLVRAVYDSDGNKVADFSKVREVRQVLPTDVCQAVVTQALARVPIDGTAKSGRLNGWTSFGKTGTAQIARKGGHGYEEGAFTATYVAGAPVNHPRLVCLISVRKPLRSKGYYGGTVSAPAVKQVMEKSLAYLEVPYDDEYVDPNDPKAGKKPVDMASSRE